MLRRIIATIASTVGLLLALGLGRGLAATPTPAPTALTPPAAHTPSVTVTAAAPTPTPPDAWQVIVFNDLDGDGLRDDGEPGLAGWHILQGCGDAVIPLTTDDNGSAVASWSYEECFSLDRQFGWLPTGNGLYVHVTRDALGGDPLLLGVHDYGRGAMELRGEAIGSGLPLVQGEPAIAEPFHSCGHLWVEFAGPSMTQAFVIVESAETRAGCPRPGDVIAPSLGGPSPAGPSLSFVPGTFASVTWVENGDSMRLYTSEVTDALVFDPATARIAHCAVTVQLGGGLIPPGFERVFVLSDEVRPGCGAPGRQVRLLRGSTPLDPLLDWHAGELTQPPQFAPIQQVAGPDTGDGATAASQHNRTLSLAFALAALACAAIGGGIVLRRR